MSSALDNPNNRKTVNLIARYALDKEKKGSLEKRVKKVAEQWFSERNKDAKKRKVSRTAMYGKAGTRGKKFKAAKKSVSKLRPSSMSRRADYAEAKKLAAQSLARLYKLKGAKASEYVERVLGAKGDAYLSSDKKMSKSYFGGTRKGSAVNVKGLRSWNARSVARRAAGKWGHAHGDVSYREKHPFAKKHASAVSRAKATLKSGAFKKVKLAKAEDWKMARKSSKKKAVSTARRRRSAAKSTLHKRLSKAMKGLKGSPKSRMKRAWAKIGKGKAAPAKAAHKRKHHSKRKAARRSRRNPEISALMNPVSALMNPKKRKKAKKSTRRSRKVSAYAKFVGQKMKAGHSMAQAAKLWKGKGKGKSKARKGKVAARMTAAFSNPRRAHKNPQGATMALSLGSAKQYFTGYALPVLVAGAAAGAVHAAARKYEAPAKIREYALKIPGIGEYVAQVPYTIQGTLVGSALAIVAPMVGGKAGEALALAGGAAIIFGGGLDAFNLVGEKAFGLAPMGDLAFGDLAFGDLAFGDLAFGDAGFKMGSSPSGTASSAPYGDGFAYMTAPLTVDLSQVDYSQASLHDAALSGADFSAEEGQAILNGPSSFAEAFGAPPVRIGNKSDSKSHLAGRPGHRWGWLMHTVGWRKAQQIADLPPKKRIEVIRKIRAAALAAAQQSDVVEQAQQLAHEAQMTADAPVSGASAQAAGGAAGAAGVGDLAFGDLAFEAALAGDDYGATLFAQS